MPSRQRLHHLYPSQQFAIYPSLMFGLTVVKAGGVSSTRMPFGAQLACPPLSVHRPGVAGDQPGTRPGSVGRPMSPGNSLWAQMA